MSAPNAFGTFLETRELLQHAPATKAAPPPEDAPLRVVNAVRLLGAQLPMPVHELVRDARLPFDDLVDALGLLRDEGLVQLREGDDGERVELTDRGRGLVGG